MSHTPSNPTHTPTPSGSPLPTGGPTQRAPHPLGPATGSQTTNFDPNHSSTRDAWQAVVTNLRDRQDRGLWSSRTIAETIAQHAGLNRLRAVDLIRSAIKHGHLEERESPLGANHTSQVRLMDGGAR